MPTRGSEIHFDNTSDAQSEYELIQAEKHGNIPKSQVRLTESNGVMVRKGAVDPGGFIQTFSVPKSGNSYFEGSWDELSELVRKNIDNFEPGSGSVDGDVILVNIPADKVKTSVVEITDENRHKVVDEEYIRVEGEKPVTRKIMKGEMTQAKYAQVVVYRADVLDRDDGRTTDAEWEMVAVLGKIDEAEPMHPTTMLRNNNHEEGGTFREYSKEEWDAAYEYWDAHAYVIED